MKKLSLLLSALLVFLSFAGCASHNTQNLSAGLSVDLTDGELIEYSDTHGGFHGDGECRAKMTFSQQAADTLCSALSASDYWTSLPMTENISSALEYGNADFPPIEAGYYLFFDRSDQSRDIKDLSEFQSRYSFNYTAAVYDADSRTLYYYDLDT